MLTEHTTGIAALATPFIGAGRSTLTDELRRARLRGFLDREARERGWWAVMTGEDGSLIETSSNPIHGMQFGYAPDDERKTFARDICTVANKHAHYNGVWSVVWFRKGRRFALVWKDWDGDIQIMADEETPFWKFKNISLDHWSRHCDEMIRVWITTVLKDLNLTSDETVRLAAGETPKVAMVPEALEEQVGGMLEDLS